MKKTLTTFILAGLLIATPASASTLTAGQIGAIISLLQAFGVNATIVATVQSDLEGTPVMQIQNTTMSLPVSITNSNIIAPNQCQIDAQHDIDVLNSIEPQLEGHLQELITIDENRMSTEATTSIFYQNDQTDLILKQQQLAQTQSTYQNKLSIFQQRLAACSN